MRTTTYLLTCSLLFLSASCSKADPEVKPEADGPLEGFYVAEAPAGAVEVSKLRSLTDGDPVVVRGDVSDHSLVEGKAVIMLYDHALKSCDEMGDADECETPWDF